MNVAAVESWIEAPLRRYVDLVNQWQLVASLQGRKPPFTRTSEGLLSALIRFGSEPFPQWNTTPSNFCPGPSRKLSLPSRERFLPL